MPGFGITKPVGRWNPERDYAVGESVEHEVGGLVRVFVCGWQNKGVVPTDETHWFDITDASPD